MGRNDREEYSTIAFKCQALRQKHSFLQAVKFRPASQEQAVADSHW